ncbi:hypothetical protein [Burkholderia ambifaria]|uniref:Uncharacterized protein n=1 Tax=Burkholderia ambifaria IOP40-10 TaxID=396596 RepID=B1FAE3_9BURK|nr:hypothetical protein [Burkholderia ambifaria]EDT05485.1 hypothetical protein BamIOP4010DRAFT_1002 [Burkholderia ambifaria IOP40-10]
MTAPAAVPDGPWQGLFRHALTLIDDIRTLGYMPSFNYCVNLAGGFLRQLPDTSTARKSPLR